VNKIPKNVNCLSCELSKRNKNATEQGNGFHSLLPGEKISADYQGKIEPPSVREFTGFYLFKNSCTGHRHAVMVKSKDAATYLSALQLVL